MADGHGGGGSSLHSHMMPAAKPTTPRWLTPALPLLSRGGDFFQAGYFLTLPKHVTRRHITLDLHGRSLT